MALMTDEIARTFPKGHWKLPLKYDIYHGYEAG